MITEQPIAAPHPHKNLNYLMVTGRITKYGILGRSKGLG